MSLEPILIQNEDCGTKILECSDLCCVNIECVKDKRVHKQLVVISAVAITIVFLILLFLFRESIKALTELSFEEFILGEHWLPTIINPHYGAFTIIVGSILVTIGAIIFAVPLGIGCAVYISEIAPRKFRVFLKSTVEILAGIPSVIYGYFGLIVLTKWIRVTFDQITGQSWLAGSILLGIMALPTIITVSEDALNAVPKEFREASFALGATRWQTIHRVSVPSAFSGIAAITLGMGRVIGETMAVIMVTGNTAKLPDPIYNVFSTVRTITATLAIEIGEVPQGSLHYSALFLMGVVLMIMVFVINKISSLILERMKEKFHPKTRNEQPTQHPSIIRIKEILKSKKFTTAKKIIQYGIAGILLGELAYVIWNISPIAFGIIITMIIAFKVIGKYVKPKYTEHIAFSTIYGMVGIIIFLLGMILWVIISRGINSGVITLQYLITPPRDIGRAGGIYPAIMGTLALVLGSIAIAIPLGVSAGIYLAEYAKDTRFTRFVRSSIDNLNATPSIIFGLFGFAFFVLYLRLGLSLIAGQITLSFLILPTIIRTTEEAMLTVPKAQREASYALGSGKWQTITKIVLPQAKPGIITGIILSMGRAAGETAPIMLTATVLTQRYVTLLPTTPVMALPYHVYMLSTNVPNSDAYSAAAAFVLLVLVMCFYAVANIIRFKSNKILKLN